MAAPRKTQGDMRASRRKSRGFLQTGALIGGQVRSASKSRGFAEARLLTHWAEIAGPALAQITEPARVSYAKGGFGATLTLLVKGANGPMVEMQIPSLMDRINSFYGRRAISRVRITQTAPSGFAEETTDFAPAGQKPDTQQEKAAQKHAQKQAEGLVGDVKDDALKQALATLGKNIFTRK